MTVHRERHDAPRRFVDPIQYRVMGAFRLDRTQFSIGDMHDPPDDVAYWRSRPPAERLAAVEFLRQTTYGYDPTTVRLQRVLEIAQREER
jgi:hypothetical protein